MTTLVVGDVHGCADELGALLDHVQPDRLVSVGDLFTKGPDPVGVFRMIRGHGAVLGNHDERLLRVVDGERPKDTHGHEVADRLDAAVPAWRAWVRALPLFLEVDEWVVVHAALHPSGCFERTPRRMALYQRRIPDEPLAPPWWVAYRGPRPVLFGHDAVRGNVRAVRAGRPYAIGLDGGCVYGGFLTGYVLEQDRFVRVRARRAYAAVT